MPTRKWAASSVTGLGALLVMWATTGAWDPEETVALIGLAVTAATTYLIPNNPANNPASQP